MELRPYQVEAIRAVKKEWFENDHKNTLLVQATGTGKTVVFASIIGDAAKVGKRSLVLAHRGELLDQAAEKIEAVAGITCAVEQASNRSVGSSALATVGSVQTLSRDSRLEQFPPDYFDFIVVDEAHHVLADSYRRILDYFHPARVLGVTATPDRADQKQLNDVFDSLAYQYDLVDAVREGYLCNIEAAMIPLEIDITQVATRHGDYAADELGTALDPYLDPIAEAMVNEGCLDRKTVVFLPLITTAEKFSDVLNRHGFKAKVISGESKDRADILEDFENGPCNVLCNSMLLTEGWDCPCVDTIAILRATKSRPLYAQMVGRGTRLHPGKDKLKLLDFLWLTQKHDLVRPAHLIAGNEDEANRITDIIESGGDVGLLDAAEIAKHDIIAEREAKLADELAANAHFKANRRSFRKPKVKYINPLEFALSVDMADMVNYVPVFAWESDEPTEGQLKCLERNGIDPDSVVCKGEAKKLIDKICKRGKLGLATAKQVNQLKQKGFTNPETWTFEQASDVMNKLASCGWKPWEFKRRYGSPESYVPKPSEPFVKQVMEYGA